jgi:hypothetical protein
VTVVEALAVAVVAVAIVEEEEEVEEEGEEEVEDAVRGGGVLSKMLSLGNGREHLAASHAKQVYVWEPRETVIRGPLGWCLKTAFKPPPGILQVPLKSTWCMNEQNLWVS